MKVTMSAEQIKVLDKRYAKRITEVFDHTDIETSHSDNDNLLCAILIDMGFHKTVKAFKETERWYA